MAALPAAATTYSNSYSGDITSFGRPDTTTYGQSFVAPGGALQSWTFFDGDSSADGARLVIAQWDGSAVVGGELYSALPSSTSASGGAYAHTFSGINLGLTSGGSYIAYLTVAGVANPTGQVGVSGSDTSPLGGFFVYQNSGGADPLVANQWSGCCWSPSNLQYSAIFSGGVPEPATWALMIGGFGLAGAALRRRSLLAA